MSLTKQQNILALTAASPEELTQKLSELKTVRKSGLAALAISGPQVLIRPFKFDNVPAKEVRNRLKLEAVELLSLTDEHIAFDHQILNSTMATFAGYFVCAPQDLIDQYTEVLKNFKLTPVKITAYAFARLNAFFLAQGQVPGRFCLLDFFREDELSLAVFTGKQCDLLREIPFAGPDEAAREVVQSIRSATAKSADKGFEEIHVSGAFEKKDELVRQLERDYGCPVKEDKEGDVAAALAGEAGLFKLNLANESYPTVKQRKVLLNVGHALIVALALWVGWSGVRIIADHRKIKEIKGNYTSKEYKYARDLEREFELLQKSRQPKPRPARVQRQRERRR